MRVLAPIFNLFAVVVLIILSASYVNFCKVIDYEFEQARYKYAVENATEAMFASTVRSEDLGLDYTDLAYVTINSSEALDTFSRIICANYDMAPSKENFNNIHDGIACVILAGYGGYYVGTFSEADKLKDNNTRDSYELRFGVRYPYFGYAETGGQVTKTYGIDAYKWTYYTMPALRSQVGNSPSLKITGHTLPPEVDENQLATNINTQLKAVIANVLDDKTFSSVESLDDFKLFFPDETTNTGVNPFPIPGIILIMQPSQYSNTVSDQFTTLSVSGFKIIEPVRIIGFTDTRTGRAYYCYESQLRDEEKDKESGGISIGGYGNFHIDDYYATMTDACKDTNDNGYHYSPYYDIMVRKVIR